MTLITTPTAVCLLLICTAQPTTSLSYVGSSTIGLQIIPEAARTFSERTGIAFGCVDVQGTGKGLQMVLEGRAALAGVSRSLTLAEKQQALHYQVIGYDALSVYVHGDNPVRNLTRRQIKSIYTGRIRNWNEVGGPDGAIVCITQHVSGGRGQVREFQDTVMDGAPYRADLREVDQQTDQASMLRRERFGVTALSRAFADDSLRAVAIDGFAPDVRHIRTGAYSLSRPLILVTPARPPADVRQFLAFMLGPEGQAIVARKFVPISVR